MSECISVIWEWTPNIDISFTIGHMGYNECVKTQAYVLQGCISFMNKYHAI